MKNALVSILLVALLLTGFIGGTINLAPVAATEVKYLTISYLPSDMPVPETVPAVGTYELAEGSEVVVEAPEVVNGSEGVRYVFDEWCVYNEETGSWYNTTDNPHTVILNANKTAYARYHVEYKLTIVTPYAKPYYRVEGGSWVQANEAWLEEDTTVQVGVYPGEVLLDTDVKAVFDYWSGDASGGRESNWFNMTGPKTAIANWYLMYYLDVDKQKIPPEATAGWDQVPVPPGEGWYEECVTVKLNATDIPWTKDEMRWKFDHWALDGEFYSDELNITVHIDGPHNATVHYIRQYWIDVSDNIGDLSNLSDYSCWINYCENLTLTAPEIIQVSEYDRYVFDHWELNGNFFSDELTIQVHSEYPPPDVQAIYKEEYYLIVQDNIGGLSDVASQSGWYEKDTVVPLGAPMYIYISDDVRYTFEKWVKDPNYVDTNNETTIKMAWHPRNATAYYIKEYKCVKSSEPITLSGWPKEWWVAEGTATGFWAPESVDPFVFYYWEINGVNYTQGDNSIWIPSVTEPLVGIAHYANKTAIILSAGSDVHLYAPGAYGQTFDVNLTLANFNSERLVNGKPMDVYGADFTVDWDPTLVECTGVTLYLDDIWGEGNHFVAANDIDNAAGTYYFSGTALGETTGFEGTKVFATLHFRVIYEPCYNPPEHKKWFRFSFTYTFVNHLEQGIRAEMVHSCRYIIEAVKPMLKMTPTEVVIQKNVPEQTFEVQIWLENAVKVKGYAVAIMYDPTKIQVVSISVSDAFPGPYLEKFVEVDNTVGWAGVWVHQDISAGAPLINGSMVLLYTVTFRVVQAIYWTPSTPYLVDNIIFDTSNCWLWAMCPTQIIQDIPSSTLGIDKDTVYYYIPLMGDLNFDGEVNVLDLQLVADHYNTGEYDITGDGKTNIFDLVKVARNFGKKVE